MVVRISQPLLGTFSDLQRRYVVDVQTMCSDAWDDDSDPVISTEEERERQKMNESYSEHTSNHSLDICYNSNDIHTSPGKYVEHNIKSEHTLIRYLKNAFFSRNLGLNMTKNTYF